MLMCFHQFKEISIMLIRILLLLFSLNAYAAYQPITVVSGSVNVSNGVSSPVPVNIVSGTISVSTAGLATEATQSSIASDVADILISSQSIDSKASSTNTALSNIYSLSLSQDNAGSQKSFITNQPLFSLGGVSTTSAIPVTFSAAGFSISGVSTTQALNTNTSISGVSTTSALPVTFSGASFSIGGVSTTSALNNTLTGVSTTSVLNAANFQGGSAVASSNPLFVSIAGVSTTGLLGGPITGVSTTSALNVAQSGIWQNSISGVSTTASINTAATQSGAWINSIGGVSTTGVLNVNISSGSIANTSFASTQSGVWNFGLNAVSTTSILNTSLQGVSTTSPLNVTQSGVWGSSITGVSTTSPLTISIGGVSTTVNVSGTVAINPNQTIITQNQSIAATTQTAKPTTSSTSFSLLTSNSARKALEIQNTSDVTCWIKKGTTATSSTGVVLLPFSGYYNDLPPIYTGAVDAICSGVNTTGALTGFEE